MKPTRRRFARGAAALVMAASVALPLAACGSSPGPGVAATADGQVITESDLDDIAQDFSTVQGAQVPSRAEMVSLLVARPFIIQTLEGSGQLLSEAGVRKLVEKQVSDVSNATVRYLQVAAVQQQLDPQLIGKITTAMAAGDIQVNPRYGTYEPGQGLVATQENWILPSDSPTEAGATPAP